MSIYFGTPRFFQGDFKTLEAIKKEGLVMSEPVKIEKWGYQGNCISTLPNCDMALKVIDVPLLEKVDYIYYHSCFPQNHNCGCLGTVAPRYPMEDFIDYSVAKILMRFHGMDIPFCGITQRGCSGIFQCMSLAKGALRLHSDMRSIYCISCDKIPENCYYDRPRQQLLMSDSACSLVVSKQKMEYELIGDESYTILKDNTLLIVRKFVELIQKALLKASIGIEEVENLFVPNFWEYHWNRIVSYFKLDASKLIRGSTIETLAHGFSADFLSNLALYEKNGWLTHQKYQIAIGYGYGNHLNCILFKKVLEN
ncbi:MAG: hypothetical protein PHP23_13835 [Desulfobacterales bacterium]|jgi:3-oxoacyl-[acyl-carrier-protein] synthase III|nr:hypothetical protein [Desulfobacterales bacterium]HHY31247.1 hypothetical protein [Syntrophaceticus sp.]